MLISVKNNVVGSWKIRSPKISTLTGTEGLWYLNSSRSFIKISELLIRNFEARLIIWQQKLLSLSSILTKYNLSNSRLELVWWWPINIKIVIPKSNISIWKRSWATGNNLSNETRRNLILFIAGYSRLPKENWKIVVSSQIKIG